MRFSMIAAECFLAVIEGLQGEAGPQVDWMGGHADGAGRVSPTIEAMIANARRRLFKSIDIRCATELAKHPPSTVRRSFGQIYGKRGTHSKGIA